MNNRLHFFRLLLILVVLLCYRAGAQNNKVPNYIPPSPLAASFKVYGDIPVSYSTGVPDISIPLYTIQVGDYALPISLRYHVKTLKPANCQSNVALGWSLDYGGMVSRTVYGKVDHKNHGPVITYDTAQGQGTGSNEALMNLWVPHGADSEHDIFNYSIPGTSGEFILDKNFQPYLMSKHPVAISMHGEEFDENIDIKDEKGRLYKFGYGHHHWVSQFALINKSSWLLSQIALPSNKVINFTYEKIPVFDKVPQGRSLSILMSDQVRYLHGMLPILQANIPPLPPGEPSINMSGSFGGVSHNEKNIKGITFEHGRIVFTLSGDKRLITGAEVYSSTGLLKTYQFVLSANVAMGQMKLLDKIIVKDKNSDTINEYRFQYHDGDYVPANAGTDYWGYFNGTFLQSFPCGTYNYNIYNDFGGLTPAEYEVSGNCQGKNASRLSSLCHAIKKIIYPTKGETEFDFELNEPYFFFGSHLDNPRPRGDGLRIAKITNRDGMGGSSTRTFTYEQPRIVTFAPDKREFATTTFEVYEAVGFAFGGNEPFYSIIKAKNTTYQPNVSSRIAGLLLTSNYSKVTEVIGESGNNIGHNIYYFQYNNHEWKRNPGSVEGPSNRLSKYKNWDTGLLYRKEVFKNNDSLPLIVTEYDYVCHYDKQSFRNTCVAKLTSYPAHSGQNEFEDWRTREYMLRYTWMFDLPHVYSYYNYDIVTGWVELKSQRHTENTSAGAISNLIEYEYNGAEKYYPSRMITHNSDGTVKTVDRRYPYDMGKSEPYRSMVTNNLIAPVVEETESLVDGTSQMQLVARKTNFHNWDNNIIKPKSIQESTNRKPLETRVEFDSYDRLGNPLQLHKTNDIHISYLWGYQGAYPIAEVKNAQVKDIFHTSFEDAEGNSTYKDSRTGHKSRTYGYVKELSNLTNGLYSLSYWQKSGNTWSYHSNLIMVEHGAYTIKLEGQVDEVRLYPSAAQMTTYTYDPLVGMTSATDANGRTTYYEYDGFGRLQLVRDQDGNILSRYCYSFSGQQIDCEANFRNTAKSRVFTKNNCPSGETGSQITYSVSAGTYTSSVSQADADAMAQADIDAKGQAYANQNGTCRQAPGKINYTNKSSSSFTVSFSPVAGGEEFSFDLQPDSDGNWEIETGTYNVTITPPAFSNHEKFSYGLNGFYQQGNGNAPMTYYKVNISSGTPNHLEVRSY